MYPEDIAINYDEAFSVFDPIKTQISDLDIQGEYQLKLARIVERARAFVDRLPLSDIHYALNMIDDFRFTIESSYTDYRHDMPKFIIDANNQIPYVRTLKSYMKLFPPCNFFEIADAEWQEVFAIYALSCVGLSINSLIRNDQSPEQDYNIDEAVGWEYYALEYACEAAEAIYFAEHLLDYSFSIEDEVKSTISAKSRNAVMTRHADKNAIKDEFVEHYRKNNKLSKTESAKRFYNNLTPEKIKYFRDEKCAIRSLLDHQRKILKQSS